MAISPAYPKAAAAVYACITAPHTMLSLACMHAGPKLRQPGIILHLVQLAVGLRVMEPNIRQ